MQLQFSIKEYYVKRTTRCFYFDNLGGSKRPLCPPYRRETQQGEDQTHWALQCGDSPPEIK